MTTRAFLLVLALTVFTVAHAFFFVLTSTVFSVACAFLFVLAPTKLSLSSWSFSSRIFTYVLSFSYSSSSSSCLSLLLTLGAGRPSVAVPVPPTTASSSFSSFTPLASLSPSLSPFLPFLAGIFARLFFGMLHDDSSFVILALVMLLGLGRRVQSDAASRAILSFGRRTGKKESGVYARQRLGKTEEETNGSV